MSFAYDSIVQMKKMLLQLDVWLEKGVEHAKAKGFDPQVLVTARLAPNQYPLARQVQSSCDNAKFGAARLSAKEPPKHPDTEQTIDELRTRIRTCVAYVSGFEESDFDGADARVIALPFLEGKVLSGRDYLVQLVLPNFYFHVTTAYSILRHSGVDLGKSDFLGHMSVRDR